MKVYPSSKMPWLSTSTAHHSIDGWYVGDGIDFVACHRMSNAILGIDSWMLEDEGGDTYTQFLSPVLIEVSYIVREGL